MALREGTRRWLMRGAWSALCISASMWVGIRVGRPIYYTDGGSEVAANTLAAAGMLRWNTPEVVVELPGPVSGRVAELPDGRLVYGRLQADGTSDLVVFTPSRPDVPPEPLYELNTVHNEVAPAIGADGSLYFASDRPDGAGGYDLYVAARKGAGFAPPVPLAACNTALDETDPAPNPNGDDFVFVRLDRRVDEGNDGELWRWRRGEAADPRPVFGERRHGDHSSQRDPVFSSDGAALWFVQRQPGARLQLQRATFAAGMFDGPLPMDRGWGSGEMRSPTPSPDGRHLGLWQPRAGEGAVDLWYRAASQELYPWWPGQRWLEWILFGVVLVSALILLLLHLGRRWSTLDLVAQCLLLSLLLHILLFLWLMGVEIVGAMVPGEDDGSGVEVSIVTTSATSAASEGASGSTVAEQVQFAMSDRAIEAAVPVAAPTRDEAPATLRGPDAEREVELTANAIATSTSIADAPAALAPRRGSDVAPAVSEAAVAAAAATASAAAAAQAAARAEAGSGPVRVETPSTGIAAPRGNEPALAGAAQREVAPPSALPASAPVNELHELHDAHSDGTVANLRSGHDAEPAAELDRGGSAVAEAAATAALAATTASRSASEAGASSPSVAAPGAELPRVAGSLQAPAGEPSRPAAEARSVVVAATLHDQTANPATAARGVAEAASSSAAPTLQPSAVAVTMAASESRAAASPSRLRNDRGDDAPALAATALPASNLAHPTMAVAPADGPATRSAPTPQPSAMRMPLHDGPPAAVARASAGNPAPSSAAATPSLAPASLQVTPDGAVAAVLPTHREPGTGTIAAPTAAAAPTSSLLRAPMLPGVPAAAMAGALANAAPSPVAHLVLHDNPRSPTGTANGGAQPAPGPASGLASRGPVALRIDAPQRSSIAAPQRAAGPGTLSLPNLLAATPPATHLPRAVALPGRLPETAPVAAATAYSNRFGPAKAKALEQYGGNSETERAVADGLRYLAHIQNADGSWGSRERIDDKYGEVSVGKTALCMLAFLGAGHSPSSHTEHSAVVDKAMRHLLSLQDDDTGAFGVSSAYGHGITTYALAECYGMTKAPELLRPLEHALTWILDNQGPRRDRRNRGGWGYFSPGLTREDDYARVSVSSWMVMALESARMSGIELPEQVLPRAREFFDLAFDQENGWFRYNHKPSRVNSAWPTLPASTPAGGFVSLLLGAAKDDAKVLAAVEFTVARRPQEYRRYDDDNFVLRGQGNPYFWYYGSLCCFLAGGDAWQQWNERLSTVLPAAQAKDGSFPPIDVYAEMAGDTKRDRSYTTAMCVLCLEVYYRYFTPLLIGR